MFKKQHSIGLKNILRVFFIIILINLSSETFAQYFPTPNDTLVSTIIFPDNRVSFKVYAPSAKEVRIGGTDIPDNLRNIPMKKLDNGVWETVIGPLEPGAYRYNFFLDNVQVIDPKNPLTSQSNMNTWSLLYVPGADFMDLRNVPHGAVSEVTYFSKSLNKFRRMHIYTPPGYEAGDQKYPTLYLLHGAFDCDDSWNSVGRAGFIMDNLLADKKIVPMIVVMPAGHTKAFSFTPKERERLGRDEFIEDFNEDIKPFIESKYRVLQDRQHRAIAGLSMGGAHALNIAIPHMENFSYLGVFSSGIFGITDPRTGKQEPTWEEQNKKYLTDENLKKDLKLVWFGIGKDDFLLETSRATINLLNKYEFKVNSKETTGGHTWKNWREYLQEFAQLLFEKNI